MRPSASHLEAAVFAVRAAALCEQPQRLEFLAEHNSPKGIPPFANDGEDGFEAWSEFVEAHLDPLRPLILESAKANRARKEQARDEKARAELAIVQQCLFAAKEEQEQLLKSVRASENQPSMGGGGARKRPHVDMAEDSTAKNAAPKTVPTAKDDVSEDGVGIEELELALQSLEGDALLSEFRSALQQNDNAAEAAAEATDADADAADYFQEEDLEDGLVMRSLSCGGQHEAETGATNEKLAPSAEEDVRSRSLLLMPTLLSRIEALCLRAPSSASLREARDRVRALLDGTIAVDEGETDDDDDIEGVAA